MQEQILNLLDLRISLRYSLGCAGLIGSGELPNADWGRCTVDPQPGMKFAGTVDSNWNHMSQKRFHCNDRMAIVLKVTCSRGTASAPPISATNTRKKLVAMPWEDYVRKPKSSWCCWSFRIHYCNSHSPIGVTCDYQYLLRDNKNWHRLLYVATAFFPFYRLWKLRIPVIAGDLSCIFDR